MRGQVVGLPMLGLRHDSHDAVTLRWAGRCLADLLGYDYAGLYDANAHYAGPMYFVPDATLICADAQRYGIHAERHLFGGAVPHDFVATKSISHPLIEGADTVPPGWSPRLAAMIEEVTLTGYAAFGATDARRAGRELLRAGHRLRLKPGIGIGGRGQRVIDTPDALDAAIAALDERMLRVCGVVLEQDLDSVTTYSVGRVAVGDLRIAYSGTQYQSSGPDGTTRYGGSDLICVRGDMGDLLHADASLSPDERLAIECALRYDAEVERAYPALFASRRNYDVAFGRTPSGERRCGVLEQSWRFGGASPAEIVALAAFRADPRLQRVHASSHEIHELIEPPAQAAMSFRGLDPDVGPLTKYSLVHSDGDTARID